MAAKGMLQEDQDQNLPTYLILYATIKEESCRTIYAADAFCHRSQIVITAWRSWRNEREDGTRKISGLEGIGDIDEMDIYLMIR